MNNPYSHPRNSTREDAEIADLMLLHSASGGNVFLQPMPLGAGQFDALVASTAASLTSVAGLQNEYGRQHG